MSSTMTLLVATGLFNGVLIGASRAVGGFLGIKVGPLWTAFWMHAVGFAFLALVLVAVLRNELVFPSTAPLSAWAGGFLGVAFVSLNSIVMPRLGTTRTTCLIIAAQMLTSVVLDMVAAGISAAGLATTGAGSVMILAGVWLAATQKNRP